MPLPNDQKVVKLANDILEAFDTVFGAHPGFRPAHAKGHLLKGTFTPSTAAVKITRADHMSRPVPVIVRFSNSTGLPEIPDNDGKASPRGMAIRFYLAERHHTDIVENLSRIFCTPGSEKTVRCGRGSSVAGTA